MRLVFGWEDMERPVAAPPGIPATRVEALRDGFDATMKDPRSWPISTRRRSPTSR